MRRFLTLTLGVISASLFNNLTDQIYRRKSAFIVKELFRQRENGSFMPLVFCLHGGMGLGVVFFLVLIYVPKNMPIVTICHLSISHLSTQEIKHTCLVIYPLNSHVRSPKLKGHLYSRSVALLENSTPQQQQQKMEEVTKRLINYTKYLCIGTY